MFITGVQHQRSQRSHLFLCCPCSGVALTHAQHMLNTLQCSACRRVFCHLRLCSVQQDSFARRGNNCILSAESIQVSTVLVQKSNTDTYNYVLGTKVNCLGPGRQAAQQYCGTAGDRGDS